MWERWEGQPLSVDGAEATFATADFLGPIAYVSALVDGRYVYAQLRSEDRSERLSAFGPLSDEATAGLRDLMVEVLGRI
jgi:hypothetical protein